MAKKFDDDVPDIDMSSYRANRINSLHRSVDDIVEKQNQKRLQISTEISSLTKEQQRLMKELDAERGEFTNETASAYSSVVRGLGSAIRNLSVGIKNVGINTAQATTTAITQYARAVGEDININKQNTVAMALSTATPLFGYFAAKFMETDVFKDSAMKLKETVGGALAGAGRSIVNIFKSKKEGIEDEDMPKLQKGGYVKKGGVVEVHPAEVVSPVDKILKALRKPDKETREWQEELLRSMSELKVAMVGTASTWQRVLMKHPSLRSMLVFSENMNTVLSTPFRILFGVRGGFAGDIRRATSTNNPYQQQTNMLALIYSRGMTYLRNIEKYTKVTAEALVGEEVSPVSDKTYTLFGKIKEFMTSKAVKRPFKEKAFDYFVDSLDLDRSALEEAGIKSFSDLLTPSLILKNMGITNENIKEKVTEYTGIKKETFSSAEEKLWSTRFDAEFKARGLAKKFDYEKSKAAKEAAKYKTNVVEKLSSLVKMKTDQEEREGPHSPSMAENIAATAKTTYMGFKNRIKTEKEKLGTLTDIKNKAKEQVSKLSGVMDWFKNIGKKIGSWIPIIFGVLVKIGKNIFSLVQPILSIAKWLGGFFATGAFKLAKGIGGAAGKVATGARAATVAGGIGGLASFFGKGSLKIAGKAAMGVGGIAIGGGMGLYDAVKAMITNPEGFVGGIITRGLAAFLGGTSTGAKGAAWGATKGGLIGAGIGSIVPGIGTAIGGAFGTIAGGILGFVGGAKISQGIKNSMSGIGEIVSAVWEFIKFPFQALRELVKSGYYLIKFAVSEVWRMIDNWLSGPGFIGEMWELLKSIFSTAYDYWANIAKDLKNTITGWFSGDWVERLKQGITDFLFPIPNLILGFKELGMMLDEWLVGLPVIGNIYAKVKGGVKSIRSGDMSESLKRALEGKPAVLNETQKAGMTAEQIAKAYAESEISKQTLTANEVAKQTEAMKKEMEKQTSATTAATVRSANTIISNNNNIVNNSNSSGGLGGGGWINVTPGSRVAERVAAGAIN